MRVDFVNEVARILDIKRRDLIEKDLILHQISSDLSKDDFFGPNFLFKGGTCLIKCYFGYLRFSEDIDFTWKDQRVFSRMSQKKIRSYLSEVIAETGAVFEQIAEKGKLSYAEEVGDIVVHVDENGKPLFMEILKASKIIPLMVQGLAKKEVTVM